MILHLILPLLVLVRNAEKVHLHPLLVPTPHLLIQLMISILLTLLNL